MVRDYNTSYERVQLTVPVFIFSIGIGQFFVGSFSDRFGRRPVIMAGLCVFIIGSILCAAAPTIELLILGRVFQGLGNSVAPVVGRAILRDMFKGDELARNLAVATAVFAIGPLIAPLIGALFILILPWPLLFVVMTLFGILLLCVCHFWLPETLHQKNPDATKLSKYVGNTAKMFKNPISLFYLILSGLAASIMLIVISGAPRLYEENFGVSGLLFAVLFSVHGIGIAAGQFVNRFTIKKYGVYFSATFGSLLLVLGGLMMFVFSTSQTMNPYLLSVTFMLVSASYLIVISNATSKTLDQHGDIAGFTSSFFGFFSQGVGSAFAVILLFFIAADLVYYSAVLFGISLFLLIALLSFGKKIEKNR